MPLSISLFELNSLVKQSIQSCLPDKYWVSAEMSDVRANSNGHCYLELIQKEIRNQAPIAKARAMIWANTYKLIKPYFEQETGQTFTSGIKVLVQVSVEFHELYGFSLNILDIDINYTLGDAIRNRKLILKQLEQEGVLTLNKEIPLPTPMQRIAIISSPTAAGYEDFITQLHQNSANLLFNTTLFPAIMQGNRIEESIIHALNEIHNQLANFDIVVIIRGGGATSDLSGFDTYPLANNCAQFPIPIFIGIGHERDETVLDEIANLRFKTPTAVAAFLIQQLNHQVEQLNQYGTQIHHLIHSQLTQKRKELERLISNLPLVLTNQQLQKRHQLIQLTTQLHQFTQTQFAKKHHQLALFQQIVSSASPDLILKRGFSITTTGGKIVKSASQLKKGDPLQTQFAAGTTSSTVN